MEEKLGAVKKYGKINQTWRIVPPQCRYGSVPYILVGNIVGLLRASFVQ